MKRNGLVVFVVVTILCWFCYMGGFCFCMLVFCFVFVFLEKIIILRNKKILKNQLCMLIMDTWFFYSFRAFAGYGYCL